MSGLVTIIRNGRIPAGATDDQIGAGNLLTVERRLAALRSVQTGRLYDLSHEISAAAPYLLPNQTPYLLSIWASFRDSIKRRRTTGATNDAGTNLERVEMTMHVGTHIDALGHFSIGDRLYNGLDAAEIVTDWGLDKLGIEHAPPMIARGVLLDVAGLDGGAVPEPGPRDLARRTAARRRHCRRLDRGRRHRADPHRLGPVLRHRQRALCRKASPASTWRRHAG